MTVEKLKEYRFEEIVTLILELGKEINDPDVEIMCEKWKNTSSSFQRDFFYTWANTMINKYKLNFLGEIRRRKIKKIEASDKSDN